MARHDVIFDAIGMVVHPLPSAVIFGTVYRLAVHDDSIAYYTPTDRQRRKNEFRQKSNVPDVMQLKLLIMLNH